MQRILYSICIGSLALALTAWGQQANDTTTVKAKATKQGASERSDDYVGENRGENVRQRGWDARSSTR